MLSNEQSRRNRQIILTRPEWSQLMGVVDALTAPHADPVATDYAVLCSLIARLTAAGMVWDPAFLAGVNRIAAEVAGALAAESEAETWSQPLPWKREARDAS